MTATPGSSDIRPYAAAQIYLDKGWTGVIPLPPKKKSAPPKSYTGWQGRDPSTKMIETWIGETTGDYQAASNIAIHMPGDVVGVDVDHYDGKTGGQTLYKLNQELGPLPLTYISTARDDGVSGIRWYRVEPGMRWPTGPGKDIEFIHKGHRYAVVWPSIHDKTGDQYHWYDHFGNQSVPPEADELAWMPDEWQARFTGGEQRREQDIPQRNATDEELAICLTDGPICYAATKALNKFEDRLNVQARHDSALRTVIALMRLGEQGHKGINSAIAELKDAFCNKVSKDRADGSEDAEYERMVDGAAVKVNVYRTAPENRGCCGSQAGEPPTGETPPVGRWLDLDEYLDGTYAPPDPCIGGDRDDMIRFLYQGRWHTVIGLTTAGKTWKALWHAKSVLESDGHVIYIHFEEPRPDGTIHRLLALGVDKEAIRKRFHWPDSRPWTKGEIAREVALLPDIPVLAVLDGINAACGTHGWDVSVASSVGEYRSMFVTPLTDLGACVLSLGHPVKAVKRQGESYSYGAAGWLNDVDGASFRMETSSTPISRDKMGSSALYSVKDRYGEVERWGELQEKDGMPWYYMGQFVVDSTPKADNLAAPTICHVSAPAKNAEGGGKDRTDYLADEVLAYLKETTGKFQTFNWLDTALRAKDLKFSKSDLPVALQKLVNRGLLEWPEVEGNKKRPGWLIVEDQS
jgi:hypothetical protein